MTRTLSIVAGREPSHRPPAGLVAGLALQLRAHAVGSGLRIIRLKATRLSNSCSRYLHVADASGREWIVRISNHYRPRRTGHIEPHLDFVSLGGASGLDRAAAAIGRIGRGELAWWPPQRSPRRKGVRR